MPECGASLLCERDIKRRHGRHGNVGHGLIHDALKGQEVVVPVAVHVLERGNRAVIHDEAVTVPHHGPDAGGLEVQERERGAAVEGYRKRHEPPESVGSLAVLIRLFTRAVGHGLVDLVLMDDGIPDLIRRARTPRRGVVFRHGAGQQPDSLRFYELHARTPGIPSLSQSSTKSDTRRPYLATSLRRMFMSRRSS